MNWVAGEVPFKSPCCGDKIYASMRDGSLTGYCAKCGAAVVRQNRTTGQIEVPEKKA